MSFIPGAIRWDAFHTFIAGQVSAEAQAIIGYAPYRANAPWFSTVVSPFALRCNATQADLDLEIHLAAQAGIKYWAYVWYRPTATIDLMAAWRLHQSSANASLVKFCAVTSLGTWIGAHFTDTAAWHANMAEWVTIFQQTNHQKVMSNRPLFYILWSDSEVDGWFGGSLANVATALTYLNGLCAAAGLGNPYVVLQGDPAAMASNMTAIGASAISAYVNGTDTTSTAAYSVLDSQAQANWATQLATGKKMVPLAMSGWSPRARRERPLSYNLQPAFQGFDDVFLAPTPAELASHLQACINFVTTHPAACESTTFLIYAWSECDESGNPLIVSLGDPPVQPGGTYPTSNLLKAIQPILTA